MLLHEKLDLPFKTAVRAYPHGIVIQPNSRDDQLRLLTFHCVLPSQAAYCPGSPMLKPSFLSCSRSHSNFWKFVIVIGPVYVSLCSLRGGYLM